MRTAASLGLASVLLLGGCETSAQKGALIGTGIGALAGQAIGGNTTSTLVGAGIGLGAGYIIGNERDRSRAREISDRGRRDESRSGSEHAYVHSETAPLGGTRWRITRVTPREALPAYTSRIVEFRPTGRVITTTTYPDGNVQVDDERYRVVGNTLVLNDDGYLINARFSIEGSQLVLDMPEWSTVLQKL